MDCDATCLVLGPPISISMAINSSAERVKQHIAGMMQPQSTERIMKALKMIMSTDSSVSRGLETIKRHSVTPHASTTRSSLQSSLCRVCNGDDHVAEGFNDDIGRNPRNFGRQKSTRACACAHSSGVSDE